MWAEVALRRAAVVAALAVSAFAQVGGDQFAVDLRAKYGPALSRQTFVVPAGEMVVDYALNGNVCSIHLPAMAPDKQRPGVFSTKAMDDFVLELAPLTLRGNESGRGATAAGSLSMSFVAYENVTISEEANATGRTGVTVTFKNEKCQDPPSHARADSDILVPVVNGSRIVQRGHSAKPKALSISGSPQFE